ncbi:MAG: hypothetical protein E6Q97_29855 [Desulfurellales bacterium]|nr:MAG: hypothetical protein E6Q97_29855 [Desulfurellales bacterium]
MDEKALEAAARAAYDYNNPHMAGKPTEAWRMYIPSIRDAITAYLEASGEARDAARWRRFLSMARVTQEKTTYDSAGLHVEQTWSFTAPEGNHRHVNHAIDTALEGK